MTSMFCYSLYRLCHLHESSTSAYCLTPRCRHHHDGQQVTIARCLIDLTVANTNVLGPHLPRNVPPYLVFCDWQVLRISQEADAAGGDNHAFLHSMVTSLSIACSVLCALSACAVVSRNARVMVHTTSFQAVVAPGLALCGVLLYGSSAFIAAGAHIK